MGAQAPGSFCWNELMTGDAEAARAFYSRLFGWQTQEIDMGEGGTYTVFKQGGNPIGGMLQTPDDELPPRWMSYVAVADVDSTCQQAEQLEAQLLVPATDIPNVGRFAVLRDPTGAVFSIFKGAE